MADQIGGQEGQEEPTRRRRGPKPFPVTKFEDALVLAKGVLQYGVGGQIRRLTLFDNLGRSPTSGLSRQLVTSSSRYNLTTGSYQAEHLTVTEDAKLLVDGSTADRDVKEKSFELAIGQFDVFQKLYERLRNRRLPIADVLNDEVRQLGVADDDCSLAAAVFLENARYVGLVRVVSGADHFIPIEQLLEEALSEVPRRGNVEPSDVDAIVSDTRLPDGPEQRSGVNAGEPSVHIDIQVHIDSSASAEQIDQVFASMARHLYRQQD